MTNRIVLYGAPPSLTFMFDVFDEQGTLIASYPSTELTPPSGRYYVDIPGSLAVGSYEILVNFQGDYIGEYHLHWNGTDILDDLSILANINSLVSLLLKYERNRTRVDKNAFTLTVYDDDGTTPLKVFNLRDFTNSPSYTEVAERMPQP